jgi:L-lactate dehydrogenase (cytochrome)
MPRIPRRLHSILSLLDLEPPVRRHLPRPLFGDMAGGAEDDTARADNQDAVAEWGLLPRVLRNVSGRTIETDLCGKCWAAPSGIAPMRLGGAVAYAPIWCWRSRRPGPDLSTSSTSWAARR